MAQGRNRWVRWLGVAPILGALMLSACGLPGSSDGQTPSAATVLAAAQAASIKDITFTAAGTFAVNLGSLGQSAGVGASNISVDSSGTGKITTSPKRADVTLSLGSSTGLSVEAITDAATQEGYFNIPGLSQVLGSSGAGWIKVPLGTTASFFDTSIFTNFEQLTQAKNIGSDTIGGVAVWHLQGKQQYSGASVTEDFYTRKDNSYPVKVVLTGDASVPTGGSASGSPSANINLTINVTAVNSGITISLPAASTVLGA